MVAMVLLTVLLAYINADSGHVNGCKNNSPPQLEVRFLQSVDDYDAFSLSLLTADDKTPKSCRSSLVQLSLNSMKSAGVSIGRPVLLTSDAGHQQVLFPFPHALLVSLQRKGNLLLAACTPSRLCRCV